MNPDSQTAAALRNNDELRDVKRRFGIIGTSPLLLRAVDRAVRVAPVDLSVLILGESGSGKEFFPKIIHQFSPRKHKKYIAVNCGAIPEGTIDSELFGHEKGSFTGAIGARKGYFEEADGGTVFLDEVAELPMTTQARLLRVLESGEFLKVGSSQVQKTDIRIVAATNVDLQKAVAEGRFREDLYYRLGTIQINVPNLHDRGDDVDLLARKFAADFSERYMTEPIRFSADARSLMHAYRWPGNVRQLKNVVEQLALFDAGREITARDMADSLPNPAAQSHLPAAAAPDYQTEREMLWQTVMGMRAEIADLRRRLDVITRGESVAVDAPSSSALIPWAEYPVIPVGTEAVEAEDVSGQSPLDMSERETIAKALRRNGGSRKRTAMELKISERTLYRKMKEYGIGQHDAPPKI